MKRDAWWEVDLGTQVQIENIEIWNRDGCCQDRLSDYYVLVSNSPNPQPNSGGVFQHHESAIAGYPTTIALPATGRYLRIQKAGSGALTIAEVRVFGEPLVAINLAEQQSATQSSTAFGGVAVRAVDGDTDGMFGAGSVTHTDNEVGAWWEVDLGTNALIETIDIWNREGCCQSRLSDYYVLVSTSANPQPGGSVAFEQFEVSTAGRPTTITLPANVIGRYVRIQKAGGGALTLAEVQVWGQAVSIMNVAENQLARQSSTAYGAGPERAVDGNTNGIFGGLSVTHTDNETDAWWEVDLGAVADIESIDLWNRDGCCQSRLSNYYVLVSTQPDPQSGGGSVTFEHFEAAVAGYPTTITMPANVTGRYVRIQKVGGGALTIAEVQVWGGLP